MEARIVVGRFAASGDVLGQPHGRGRRFLGLDRVAF